MKEFLINKKRVSDLRDLVDALQKKIRSGGYHLPAESLEAVSQSITEFLKVEEDYERFENI